MSAPGSRQGNACQLGEGCEKSVLENGIARLPYWLLTLLLVPAVTAGCGLVAGGKPTLGALARGNIDRRT